MAVCTAAVLLMLGIGNHQYLTRFQKPYSFDAASEMKVELIEAPLVLNPASKPDARMHVGSPNSLDKNNTPAQHPDDTPDLYAKTR